MSFYCTIALHSVSLLFSKSYILMYLYSYSVYLLFIWNHIHGQIKTATWKWTLFMFLTSIFPDTFLLFLRLGGYHQLLIANIWFHFFWPWITNCISKLDLWHSKRKKNHFWCITNCTKRDFFWWIWNIIMEICHELS